MHFFTIQWVVVDIPDEFITVNCDIILPEQVPVNLLESAVFHAKGTNIHLTQTEFNILAFLSEHAGKVPTYSTIIRSIWGAADSGSIKILQVNMANIRKKCGTKPGDNRYIINELGIGYRMRTDDELT